MMNSIQYWLAVFVVVVAAQTAWAGVVYQNFEDNNGIPVTIWGSASVVGRSEAVYSGDKALKMSSSNYWSVAGVEARPGSTLDIRQTNNDRLSFWIFAKPVRLCYIYGCGAGTNNTVGVRLYDNGIYQTTGFEVWTTQTANFSQWSKLKILFSQLPADFNLRQVTKVEFKQYMPGNYYIDDIQAVREDRTYQTFEKEERAGSTDNEYGWKWNDVDAAAVSGAGEPAHNGAHSWKLTTALKWSGTGIQSQDKALITTATGTDQSFWNADLAPDFNNQLTFWVYALPENGMDNNISVQFYDNNAHATDDTKVAIWPNRAAVTGQWTRLSVSFDEIRKAAPDFNFKNINKIQFQSYWPGTFYIDDIAATGPIPTFSQHTPTGTLTWSAITGTNIQFRLQQSPTGKDGTWKTVYYGPLNKYVRDNTATNFFRVRWEEPMDPNAVPYVSDWSEVFEFIPAAVVFNYANIRNGNFRWKDVYPNTGYEIQSASSMLGPWTLSYQGAVTSRLSARKGMWYRIRGVEQKNGVLVGVTPWSRPQTYAPGAGYVKAVGQVLKDNDGKGNTLVLNGVNLGGALVNEPWMTGIGSADTPPLDDDWSLRNQLSLRFSPTDVKTLLTTYQNAYLTGYDFDYLLKLGVTVVRLPFWYRNLQDDNGNWILNASGQIDFLALDRLVSEFADRGIYVVLDLHGAPGLQSADANTGRKGFNKLFAGDGEVYRQRTVALWKEVARHFKENTWVVGYDLLNEPVGAAPNTVALADLYDRLYKAIRLVDTRHLIMMEGIWFTDTTTNTEIVDWATLPNPSVRNWSNVLYQFHFYHWDYVDANGTKQKADEDYPSHKAFIDDKVAKAKAAQTLYNVPVMVGEFYGFGIKDVWKYYTDQFNQQRWSWTSWSYKYHDSPQNWGIVNHSGYDEALPNINNDSYADLQRKFSKYSTHVYHSANVALQRILSNSTKEMRLFPPTPYLYELSALFLEPGQELTITGNNFGALDSSSVVKYQGMSLPIIEWTNTSIRVAVPSSVLPGNGLVTVTTFQGTSNGLDLIVVAHDPSLDPQPSTATGYQLPDTFMDTFVRCNGQPLGTHGCV